MKFKKLFCCCFMLFSGTVHAGVWQVINDSVQPQLEDYKANSPVLQDMRIDDEPNRMVYADKPNGISLMPIYDLIACFHITNPKAEITVDSASGYDIRVDSAKFAKGSWPADIEVNEIETIDLLEKNKYLILGRVSVNLLRLKPLDQRKRVVQMMSAACFNQ